MSVTQLVNYCWHIVDLGSFMPRSHTSTISEPYFTGYATCLEGPHNYTTGLQSRQGNVTGLQSPHGYDTRLQNHHGYATGLQKCCSRPKQ